MKKGIKIALWVILILIVIKILFGKKVEGKISDLFNVNEQKE